MVVGTPLSRTAGSAHVVNRRQLERLDYDDPHAALQQVPGVYVRQEDGVGLRPNIGVRGVNPDRSKKVTLLEDGVLFGPAPYSAPAAYYFPMMTRMVQLRVIKGPAAVAFGPQTVGGAVDLVTRSVPTSTAGAIDVAAGEYGYAKAHGYFGSGRDDAGFIVEGVRLQNTGFKELPNGGDTGFTRNEWMAKFRYVVDPTAEDTHELGLKLTYSDEVSNETYLGLSDADFRRNPYQRYAASALDQMKSHRFSLVAAHTVEVPSAALRIETKAYRHDYARVWRKVNRFRGASIFGVLTDVDDPTNAAYYEVLRGAEDSGTQGDTLLIGPNDRTFVSQGVQSVFRLDAATGPVSHRVEWGIRLHHDEIERRHSEDGFAMTAGQLVPDGTPTAVTQANIERSYALALHATDAVSYGRLSLTPGVRVEIIRSEEDDRLTGAERRALVRALVPGVGAYFGITDELGVLGGVYRGFSPPPPGSDAIIEPEYSVNYEYGARFSAEAARIEVIAFYNDYTNLTDICTLSSGCVTEDLDRQFDAGEARIFGLEAFASHELRAFGATLPLSAAYTVTRAEFSNSFDSQDPIYGRVRDGDEIPYVPRHQLNATAAVETRHAGGVAALNYVSRMREEAGTEPLSEVLATDAQLTLDLGVNVRPLPALTVYGHVRNVLNAQDIVSRRPYGARPNAPRWIQVGAKVQF